MRDLSTSIREYYDAAAEPVEAREIFDRFDAESHPQRRRLRPLVVAAAAAIIVFATVGAVALFGPFGESDEVIDEPTPVTTMTPTSVPDKTAPTAVNVLPESSSPDPIDLTSGVAFADGWLWASTGAGMVRWDLEERSAELFTSADGLPFTEGASSGVAVAPDGTVWAFTWNQDLAYFDGTDWSEPAGYDQLDIVNPRCVGDEECPNPITAMAVGPDGVLSLAVGSETLLRFDGVDWSVLPVTPAETGGGTAWTGDMAVASDGTLWAASWEELLAYDGDTWARYTTADGLPSGGISSVAVAPNGDIWVGTTDNFEGDPSGGVARFDGDSWTVFDETDGLYENAATGLTVGPDGTVWAIYGANDDPSAGMERAAGGISRFDGMTWSTETIPDVGMGFGRGGPAVDNTGTLWIGTRWGVVGFDGTDTTVLRVPQGTRPVIEVPHVVIEGGEDILATTVAKPTPPVATCPTGSDPNRPGPVGQTRPPQNYFCQTAIDRQSGRIVTVVEAADGMALETWTFDVCTNTWTLMGQPSIHRNSNLVSPALVYDADSDIVVAIGALGVDTYDVDTDTWVRHGKAPSNVGGFNNGHAVYDPVSGLIVVRSIVSSEMWAYDVDIDIWTPIRQGPISPPGNGGSFYGQIHAYDAGTDRIVLYLADTAYGPGVWDGAGPQMTWTYDLRAGQWTVEDTVTPELMVGGFWVGPGKAAYDETAQRTVITADGLVGGYDAAQHEWEILWQSSSEPNAFGSGTGPHHRAGDTIVYDPTNDRIVVIGGDARLLEEDPFWVSMNDVWAFNTNTGTWTELLAQSTP